MKIENIPTDTFNRILEHYQHAGWRNHYEYIGFDAWIDYGKVILSKGQDKLIFEWDNWFEGTIEGAEPILRDIQQRFLAS